MDTHCLRSSSDRWAGKCGGKCGVSASDRYASVTFVDAMTPSVSGQHLCLGMRASVGSGAGAGSPMSATVRGGWSTVNRCHSVPRGRWPHCRRSESGAEDQGAVSPLVTTGGGSRTSFVVCLSVRRSAGGVSGLELAACVSVAGSAEIRLSVDRARAMSSRISTRFAPAMAPRIAVTSPISRTPHTGRRSDRRDQPMTTEF